MTWQRVARWVGLVLVVGGTSAAVWALATDGTSLATAYKHLGLAVACLTAVIVGALLVVYSALARFTRDVNEAYRLGEDIGVEKEAERARLVERPVVVDLKDAKEIRIQVRRANEQAEEEEDEE